MREIQESEFKEWLQNPVTEALFETLNQEAESLAHGLSQGAYTDDPNERMFMGYVRALREVVNTENLRLAFVVEEENE